MAAEKMLAGAMPHYDSGMQGLNRFLRLVNSGGTASFKRLQTSTSSTSDYTHQRPPLN
jgi:hypothetical protein